MRKPSLLAVLSLSIFAGSAAAPAQAQSAGPSARRVELLAKVPDNYSFGCDWNTTDPCWTVLTDPTFGRLEVIRISRPGDKFDLIGLSGHVVRIASSWAKTPGGHQQMTEKWRYTQDGEPIVTADMLQGLPPNLQAVVPAYARDKAATALQDSLAVERQWGVESDDGLEAFLRRARLIQ